MDNLPIFKFALRSDLNNNPLFMPAKGTPDATGWDVAAAPLKPITLRAGQYAKIPLGFRVLAPAGFWVELRPRSSTFAKKQLNCLYGVIDQDFFGECMFACQYIPDISSLGNDITISAGDKIGQIIPVRRQEMKVEIISNEEYQSLCQESGSQRNPSGFGTTGK